MDPTTAAVLVGGLFAVAMTLRGALSRLQAGIREAFNGDLATIGEALWSIQEQLGVVERLDALEAKMGELVTELTRLDAVCDSLPVRWDEMYAKVRRTEERARGAVRRAREELAEHGFESGELEGTLEDLRREYGDGGEDGRLSPMRESVEDVPAPSGPPPREPSLIDLRNARLFG